jgi:hypothetical protein
VQKGIQGRLPGQSAIAYQDSTNKALGLAIYDLAIKNGPLLRIVFGKDQARTLIANLIDIYEGLYDEPFQDFSDDVAEAGEAADSQAV